MQFSKRNKSKRTQVPDVVAKWRNQSLLQPSGDKVSFWGAIELDLCDVPVSEKEADDALEVIQSEQRRST